MGAAWPDIDSRRRVAGQEEKKMIPFNTFG
jgi:hypothetical protein